MVINLHHLERAVRSQFFLLHKRESESEWEWQQRRARHHPLHCDEIESRNFRGMAISVFVGLADEFHFDEETVCEHLGIKEKLRARYYGFYRKHMDRALHTLAKNSKLPPDKLPGKIYNKTGLVKSWLKWNLR